VRRARAPDPRARVRARAAAGDRHALPRRDRVAPRAGRRRSFVRLRGGPGQRDRARAWAGGAATLPARARRVVDPDRAARPRHARRRRAAFRGRVARRVRPRRPARPRGRAPRGGRGCAGCANARGGIAPERRRRGRWRPRRADGDPRCARCGAARVHGLVADGRARKRSSSASHEVCRLCGARLPAGRLDPHLTAAHGIFHVHPRGESSEERRAAAIRDSRRTPAGLPRGTPRESSARLDGSLLHAPSSGRDFLGEARVERTLVARADSPLRNRERSGRFSDAPDVERMDGDSEA